MTQPIKIAILAMGGEGGGVLADWLVDLAEHNGHLAQTTSVPGVAQRTGATIYYVELFPEQAAHDAGALPVLALMPLPGDVDVVLASELMEAGRAVQRGLVTPERTTLVASTHRVYALAEKTVPGDGRADADALLAQARAAARRFVGFDMERAAADSGSVVSAVLFGALAASGALPFERAQFEATIERGGVGVAASLRAFASAFSSAAQATPEPATPVPFALPRAADAGVQALIDRAAQAHRAPVLALAIEGLRRLIDYQDPRYAALYLDRIDAVLAAVADRDGASTLGSELARHLALWMSYEDGFRVADLKRRGERFERVRRESGAAAGELTTIHDYLHPRVQEIADALPAALGRWLLASTAPRRLVERLAARGRVVHATSLRGYLLLSALAALRRWRRGSLRHQREDARIAAWLADVRNAAAHDVALATEIVRCQRLVKGYGDTHERGWSQFERLRPLWQRGAAPLAAATLAELRDAALADAQGRALQAALQRHALA